MSDADLARKFSDLWGNLLPAAKVGLILDACSNLEMLARAAMLAQLSRLEK